MSSTGFKQNHNDIGYYINLGSLRGIVYAYNPAAANQFSTATWAYSSGGGVMLSSLQTAGAAILKDLGKTVVSSLRTFRKVQMVLPSNSTLSTFGVGGRVGTTNGEDYLTGYIELGFEGNGSPAPVAHYGR